MREGVLVDNGTGILDFCRVPSKGKSKPGNKNKYTGMPVPGDVVYYEPPSDTKDGWIQSIDKRKSLLQRFVFGRIKEIAANIDQIVLLATIREPVVSPRLVDRILVGASVGGIKPIIVVNKSDLNSEDDIQEYCEPWSTAGFKLFSISSIKNEGLEELIAEFKGRTSLLYGASGVGKSTLLNILIEDLNLDTSAISETSGRGVHTTTHTYIYPFSDNSFIADTPGIREFYPAVEPEDLRYHYLEFEIFAHECEWRNCLHIGEKGCAVEKAVEESLIHLDRYKSYRILYDSLLKGPKRGRQQTDHEPII